MQPSDDNSPPLSPQRRKALILASGILGATAAGLAKNEVFIQLASAHTPRENSLEAGQLFDQSQMQTLSSICAIVIPNTDTLGAHEVDTQGFIDQLLIHCYGKDEQQQATRLLNDIDAMAQSAFDATLIKLDQQAQFELLTAYDSGSKEIRGKSIDEKQIGAFKFLKSLIALGYVTSEEGATQHLQYVFLPPNSYEADVPLKEFGRAASTVGFY